MNPILVIETLVFVSAEASLFLEQNASNNHLPLAVSGLAIAVFASLRVALPWAARSRRNTDVFFLGEVALLITIAINVTGAALIITSVSVCLRSVELVRPARGAVAYTVVTLGIVLVAMTGWALLGGASWEMILGWIVDLVLAWGLLGVLVTFAANERRNNDELRATQRELITYAAAAADAGAIRERARIALDLHDEIGHGLTALNVHLEGALRLRDVDPIRADAFIASAKALASNALADVRAMVARFRHDESIDASSLEQAIAEVCDRFERDFGLRIERRIQTVDTSVDVMTVARIAGEALNNVARHAGPTTTSVSLLQHGASASFTIADGGCGFDAARVHGGNGFAIMRERARRAQVDIDIASEPQRGTQIRLSWSRENV